MYIEKIISCKMNGEDLNVLLNISKDINNNYYVTIFGMDIVKYFKIGTMEEWNSRKYKNCVLMKFVCIIIGFTIIIEYKFHVLIIDRKYKKNCMKYLNYV